MANNFDYSSYKETQSEHLKQLTTDAQHYSVALLDDKQSKIEKFLRKIPPFKALYAKIDALVFYVKQLSTLTYTLSKTATSQQTQINTVSQILLEVVKEPAPAPTSSLSLDNKKKFSKPN